MKRCVMGFIVVVILTTLGYGVNTTIYAQEKATSATIEFTKEEQQFIKEHPVIQMGVDPEFMPYEFIDTDGKYKGIAADYIQLISKKIGIKMQVQQDKTWAEAYEMAVKKNVDVLPCVAKTTERQQYFLFSDPYYTVQRVVVVQESNDAIKSMEDLKYTTVAVQKNSSHNSFLKGIPEINLSLYTTPLEALTAVSKGSETAFVGYLATSAYLIEANGLTHLKYIAIGSQEEQQHLYFAVRNDWPLLVSIINKGLASITEEEKMTINDKWVGVTNEVDYSVIIKIIIAISGIIILGILISFFWIVRLKKEIAKRIVIEKELKQAKVEAENANMIKSTFLARMSHEIRTPLNAIMGMSYLMKKNGISFSQKVYINKINEATRTMLDVINDILDFSKIESGKMEIELKSFNLDKVIQQVISIISFKIEEQNIEFAFAKDPKIPSYFIGDAIRIEQILLNLLTNAVKFTNEGEVSLNIKVSEIQNNIYTLEFIIKDSGIGISEEHLNQLFKPFVQADSSINRRFGGTGLGLSIVKSFTELMKGSISIDSEVGKGSAFTVLLPLEFDNTKDYEKNKDEAFSYLQKIDALVFVKNVTLKTLLDTYLQNFGIYATFVKDESDVLKLLKTDLNAQKEFYNLLIIDYDILDEETFEFTKNIMSNAEIPNKPKVIMLIPMNREDLYEQIEMNGLNLGILKPIIPSVLYDGILEIFNRVDLINCGNQTPISREERKAKKNYKVLVVDDNKTNQFIARTILEQVGISVVLASNGEEGVTYFTKYTSDIDLILMDLHMPVLNGYEASKQIRIHNKEIPIVAMTADAIAGVEKQCQEAGIHQYISKPFEPDKFIQIILDILEAASCDESNICERADVNETVQNKICYINQEEALTLLGNNIQLYQMVLNEFFKETETILAELEIAMKNDDLVGAAQIVHKVKGSAGNVGASKLYKTSMLLQKALE
ncbi:MAG: transporter substrate-binding domain-containing protein, partial [Lachnospiraceae bacterium]|nr:transporter substrate-binding domain-containing protein [Lachnospiraceae bacterium]